MGNSDAVTVTMRPAEEERSGLDLELFGLKCPGKTETDFVSNEFESVTFSGESANVVHLTTGLRTNTSLTLQALPD